MHKNLSEIKEAFESDEVRIAVDAHDIVVIEITNRLAAAKLALHGAHVMSYTPVGEADLLWMSKSSWFEHHQPIRGGIPVCWPWFGGHPTDSSLPSHGFARISAWQLENIVLNDNGSHSVTLGLSDNDVTRKMWDFAFKAELTVTVGAELRVELMMRNCDTKAFEISAALHTYFAVADISHVTVAGFDGCAFIDTLDDSNHIQTGDITFSAETDNIYLDTTATAIICDAVRQRKIAVAKNGSTSTVIWNPWIAKAVRMPDFGDDEYTEMLCVETTNAQNDARTIAPGAEHRLETIISLC